MILEDLEQYVNGRRVLQLMPDHAGWHVVHATMSHPTSEMLSRFGQSDFMFVQPIVCWALVEEIRSDGIATEIYPVIPDDYPPVPFVADEDHSTMVYGLLPPGDQMDETWMRHVEDRVRFLESEEAP